MEKKKSIKKIIPINLSMIFVGMVILHVISFYGYGISLAHLLYWILLLVWVSFVWKYNWGSDGFFKPAFILFILGVILTVFGVKGLGEVVMRISFIGWLAGIVQSLIEYRKEHG